ncbi:CoA binding domain protein [Luminiphilus syltensis NOR5-1B]|uniref:CoA binding domain protein n=1 Tax=Luminiphilus syltensis NOR5-1B TaxID=565045 RepID=B8KXJ0_9GAMM|nr:CoA-binding protein [Luminiphilus syltensis]EED35348.1 CoA binding domain protein [Luminiphilus syltensis NOR5-1B]
MPVTDDAGIAEILKSVRTVALLGASSKPVRPSYQVSEFLRRHGYRVIPVNPGLAGSELHGERVYGTLADIPEPVDMVDVFRNARFLPAIVEETIQVGVPLLWTQLGVIDPAATMLAEQQGIRVVVDRCPAIEWPRLRAAGLLDSPKTCQP